MSTTAYRLDIQGLRAVAVLAVVLFHYDGTLLPGGFIGVDIFLVISGYLITQQLYARRMSDQYSIRACLGAFYFGRIKRIVPAYFVMLAVVAVLAKLLFTNTDYGFFSASLRATALFASNQYFARFGDYFAPALAEQPLLHTWSLAVEMQFYLLLPALILAVSASRLRWVISVLILGLILLAEWQLRIGGHVQETYYALYARVPEFLVGALLAIHPQGDTWSRRQADGAFLVGAALIAGSIHGLGGVIPFPGLWSLPPTLGAALIIAARHSGFSRLLSNPFMVWIGFLSYSIYLWHWAVLALIRYYTGANQLGFKATLFFVLATLGLSCLSFYLVEEPARGLRLKALTLRRMAAALALSVCGLLGVYGAVQAARGLVSDQGLPIEYTRYADPAFICHGTDNGHCVKGDPLGTRHVAVIGDSHAAMLNGFFDTLGQSSGFKATVLTASSCVPFPGFNVDKLPEWARDACRTQIDRAQALVARSSVVIIAGMWSYQVQDPTFPRQFERYLSGISKSRRVYVLSQVPQFTRNPMRLRRFAELGLPHRVPVDEAYQRANHIIAQAANAGGANYLALDGLDVFGAAPYRDGQLIYMDESHLNEIGIRAYAQEARYKIRKLIDGHGN